MYVVFGGIVTIAGGETWGEIWETIYSGKNTYATLQNYMVSMKFFKTLVLFS